MNIAVIGSGFAGISAAAYLAKAGHEVRVFEKHDGPGGRARQFKTSNGYTFDMGPSWYWMPDIIENFFQDFQVSTRDYYSLTTLNPQFDMVFADEVWSIPSEMQEMCQLFERAERGAGEKLIRFMQEAKVKYEVGMREFVHKPCHSWWEFVSPKTVRSAVQLDLLTKFDTYVRKYFQDPRLIALMEFPVLFLGAAPNQIPAMYSLMHYGGPGMGTHYPMGGMYEIIRAMVSVAEAQGVEFCYKSEVTKIDVQGQRVVSLETPHEKYAVDAVIAAADYHHVETQLLPRTHRNYDASYWENRTMAPSCLIYYLGINKRIPQLRHHTLFFEYDLREHTDDIYTSKRWPRQPLFYVCCPSKTDDSVAPPGHENLFLLMPVASEIEDGEEIRELYFREMIARIEKHTGIGGLTESIDYKQSYCIRDFVEEYHAYRGNAYGLANTLSQTAVLKPSIRNRHLQNLWYAGQLTVPGPGVPPSIISGKIAAGELMKRNKAVHEKVV